MVRRIDGYSEVSDEVIRLFLVESRAWLLVLHDHGQASVLLLLLLFVDYWGQVGGKFGEAVRDGGDCERAAFLPARDLFAVANLVLSRLGNHALVASMVYLDCLAWVLLAQQGCLRILCGLDWSELELTLRAERELLLLQIEGADGVDEAGVVVGVGSVLLAIEVVRNHIEIINK